MSRLGLFSRWNATGTGLAQPNRKGELSSSSTPGQDQRAERVDMADRVEADAAQAPRGVVAQPVGHPGVRRLVERDRGDHGQEPDRELMADRQRDRSCARLRPAEPSRRWSPRPASNGVEAVRRANRVPARASSRRERGRRSGEQPRTAVGSRSPGQCRARSQPAASAAACALAGVAAERPHGEIVAEQQAAEAELARGSMSAMTRARQGGRQRRIERR